MPITDQLPKTIKIGGVTFKIVVTNQGLDSDDHGAMSWDDKKITLSPQIKTKSELKTVLYHEMAHAALAVSGMKWLWSDETEEAVVRMLETLLIPAILRTNDRL